jgi:hypothetical protein
MRWTRHLAFMGHTRNIYKSLIRKPKGKILLRILRHTQKDNIKTDAEESVRERTGFNWLRSESSGGF